MVPLQLTAVGAGAHCMSSTPLFSMPRLGSWAQKKEVKDWHCCRCMQSPRRQVSETSPCMSTTVHPAPMSLYSMILKSSCIPWMCCMSRCRQTTVGVAVTSRPAQLLRHTAPAADACKTAEDGEMVRRALTSRPAQLLRHTRTAAHSCKTPDDGEIGGRGTHIKASTTAEAEVLQAVQT